MLSLRFYLSNFSVTTAWNFMTFYIQLPQNIQFNKHVSIFFCLIFQTLFRHFRHQLQLLSHNGLSFDANGISSYKGSTLCLNLILLTLRFYNLYLNLYCYQTISKQISRIMQTILTILCILLILLLMIVQIKESVFCMVCFYIISTIAFER